MLVKLKIKEVSGYNNIYAIVSIDGTCSVVEEVLKVLKGEFVVE